MKIDGKFAARSGCKLLLIKDGTPTYGRNPFTFVIILIMKRLPLFFLFLFLSGLAGAQQKIVADKIIGIVGDRIILQSDVKNAIADLARQGSTGPEGAECQILEQDLISKVMMLQVEKVFLKRTDG